MIKQHCACALTAPHRQFVKVHEDVDEQDRTEGRKEGRRSPKFTLLRFCSVCCVVVVLSARECQLISRFERRRKTETAHNCYSSLFKSELELDRAVVNR